MDAPPAPPASLASIAPDDVASYRRRGHLLARGVATADELAPLRRAAGALVAKRAESLPLLEERSTYDRAFVQAFNLWQRDADVARFVLSSRFARIAAALLGVARVRLYHDQALFKEPGGGPTPWHQDAIYWPLDGARCVTMWMPLVDVTPESGGVCFASGSHTRGALSDVRISDESDERFDRLIEDARFPIAEPVAMRAGDATFHSGWTAHRALPNRSASTREVMTVIWFADGLVVREPANRAQRNDLAMWLPGLSPGDRAATPANPLLPGPDPGE